jgi:hypothetical protein
LTSLFHCGYDSKSATMAMMEQHRRRRRPPRQTGLIVNLGQLQHMTSPRPFHWRERFGAM